MSRGIVKEDDQEKIPMAPPRADLPEGATNYVTQVGMNELLAEKQTLIYEKSKLDSTNENEKRIALNQINAKLQLLDQLSNIQVLELRHIGNEIVYLNSDLVRILEST